MYSLTAIKTDTRLLISHHDGGRTTEDSIELFEDIEKKRDPNRIIGIHLRKDF
jgi:hypothetical protein